MDDRAFNSELENLLRRLDDMAPEDRERLESLAHAARSRQERMKQTLGELQDSLDHLRVSVKYLVFDLEATRRENQYLRRLIEAQGEQRES